MDDKKFHKVFVALMVAGGIAVVTVIVLIVMAVSGAFNVNRAMKDSANEAFAKSWNDQQNKEEREKVFKDIDDTVKESQQKSGQSIELLKKAQEAIENGDNEEAVRLMKEISGE